MAGLSDEEQKYAEKLKNELLAKKQTEKTEESTKKKPCEPASGVKKHK